MFLPYERQITELLQELMHFRAVAVRSQQEKARYAEELNETCQEIEQALYEMGKRQTIVLRQWETISDGDRSRILSPVSEGVEKMSSCTEKRLQSHGRVSGGFCYGRSSYDAGPSQKVKRREEKEKIYIIKKRKGEKR